MKKIDHIIQENRSVFDSQEPREGHFERFEQKLNMLQKRKARFTLSFILKAAAVTLLVTLSGLYVYEQIIPQKEISNGIALHQISPEYNEVEIYYSTLVSQKYHEINSLEFSDSTQKAILITELNQMDSIYENLKNDLKINPTDERVINAMIQHYQLKVEVMNQILNQLHQAKTINQQKSDNYESTEI
ncbi:MAG: hypothetical protein A2041_12515 [Bacteroidetes bacterium GWA2_31_9b]|nr:MAG: hypothetical protein A2041_12515 [Bacteroidetes bacterium GWA2_31_9b]